MPVSVTPEKLSVSAVLEPAIVTPVKLPAVMASTVAIELSPITVLLAMAWIVSVPTPPVIASKPSPVPVNWNISLPAPPVIVSSPVPPEKVAAAAGPVMVSLPAPPSIRAMPVSVTPVKLSVSAPADPDTVTPVKAPALIASTVAIERKPMTVLLAVAEIVSVPTPPVIASKPSPVPVNWKVSSPPPPSMLSLPAPPAMTSLPDPR